MGGRLDAVNLLDADAAAVVSVGLDHREWLGDTVEAIGHEKAGIFRAGRPAIFGGRQVPKSIVAHAAAIGARLRRIGTDFDFVERADGWDYVGFGSRRRELPLPALAGSAQLGNAAVALALLEAVEPRLLVPDEAVRAGLAGVRLPGPVPGAAGIAGMDPRRRTQPAGCPGAGGEPRRASLRGPDARRLRDPRRQGHRRHRGRARWPDRPLDRGRARRRSCTCRRRRSPSASAAPAPRRCWRPRTWRRGFPRRAPR